MINTNFLYMNYTFESIKPEFSPLLFILKNFIYLKFIYKAI